MLTKVSARWARIRQILSDATDSVARFTEDMRRQFKLQEAKLDNIMVGGMVLAPWHVL